MRKGRDVFSVILLLAIAPAVSAQESCEPSGDVEFVCGLVNAEDLVLVPETDWIVSSGMAAGAGFYLIDSISGDWRPLPMSARHDGASFPNCPAPPAVDEFESHGLNIRPKAPGLSMLYVVGHGAREAVEVFEVDARGDRPTLTWQGCVLMPEGLAANSVASLPDDSIVATVLFMPGTTFADAVVDMRPTGAVFEWAPGDSGFTKIEGTELPANNGIEVSADGSELYVVSSGFQTIVKFSNTNPARQLGTTSQLPITPDNVHMGPDGRLLTAGMKNDVPECGGPPGPEHSIEILAACPRGTIAIAVDPATMEAEVLVETPALESFSNATMVLPAAGRYWFGTFSGNRIASAPRQDVVLHRDIAYKSGDLTDYERERSRLDLYLPGEVAGFPTVVWFHGGGLTAGDKAEGTQAAIARSLAERGIGVVSVNYRLSPRASFPAYVEDAAASVAWVLDHIEDYGGEPGAVFVSGHSAGGYLAAMVGLDEQYLAAHGHGLDDLAGLIPISGQMVTHATVRDERGFPSSQPLVDAAAPAYHVRPDAPPFLAIAGSDDLPARPEENRYVVAALQAVEHSDATYLEFEGRNHGTIVTQIPNANDPVARAISEFIERQTR
jgi:acetyl esterase/lipase